MFAYIQCSTDLSGGVAPRFIQRCAIDGNGDVAVGVRNKGETATLLHGLVCRIPQIAVVIEDRSELEEIFRLVGLCSQFVGFFLYLSFSLAFSRIPVIVLQCLSGGRADQILGEAFEEISKSLQV